VFLICFLLWIPGPIQQVACQGSNRLIFIAFSQPARSGLFCHAGPRPAAVVDRIQVVAAPGQWPHRSDATTISRHFAGFDPKAVAVWRRFCGADRAEISQELSSYQARTPRYCRWHEPCNTWLITPGGIVMNKLIPALIAACALAACTDQGPAARAGNSLDGAPDRNAAGERVAVQTAAGQNCYEIQVERAVPPGDEKKIAGTAIGAVVGGAVGKEIGDDNDLATAAGAAAGAYAGRVAQDRYQENRTETVTEVRCN
jgi:uncharacterized protein YcfJ